jgi:hypothetical protein
MTTILKVTIKPYTSKELAGMFNASKSTFNRDLKPHREKLGLRLGHRWNIHQVELILALFGRPYVLIEE